MIKQLFSDSELDRWFEVFQSRAEAKIYEKLQEAGEMFVRLARESGTYNNQTNNLRSSIGYVIVKDGNVLEADFQKTGNGQEGDGSEGLVKGKKMATAIASGIKGFVLIGVAGMEYAIYVESKGLEVISASAQQSEMLLRKSIQTLFEKAARNEANYKG